MNYNQVFVLNKHGKPLMPCKPRKARILLKKKQAKVVSHKPFTIQLTIESENFVQPVTLGVDTGSKHIGYAVTSENKVLHYGEVTLRQDVSKLIATRAMYRRSRRNRLHYRKARFLNRKRKAGWLPPSVQSKVDHTIRFIDTLLSVLPNAELRLEIGQFDIQRIKNPNIKAWDYANGEAKGYDNIKQYVKARDHYTCQICKGKNKPLHVHHIKYKSLGGSNSPENLLTVCTDCHTREAHQPGGVLHALMLKNKTVKTSYKHEQFMLVIAKRLMKQYPTAHYTYGYITRAKRRDLGLTKTHYNDAVAICNPERIDEKPDNYFKIVQFRKKKRSLHEATARKGRKVKNTESKRYSKNTKEMNGYCLGDYVEYSGRRGYVTGFSGKYKVRIKDINGEYIQTEGKPYSQVSMSRVRLTRKPRRNNWLYETVPTT